MACPCFAVKRMHFVRLHPVQLFARESRLGAVSECQAGKRTRQCCQTATLRSSRRSTRSGNASRRLLLRPPPHTHCASILRARPSSRAAHPSLPLCRLCEVARTAARVAAVPLERSSEPTHSRPPTHTSAPTSNPARCPCLERSASAAHTHASAAHTHASSCASACTPLDAMPVYAGDGH